MAVWERQQRGALHWHLAVIGRQNIKVLRRCWSQIVGENNGGVHIRGPRGRQPGCITLAQYIAKGVLTEQEGRRSGQHRFVSSKCITIPKAIYQLGRMPFVKAVEMAKTMFRALTGVEQPYTIIGHHKSAWAFLGAYLKAA